MKMNRGSYKIDSGCWRYRSTPITPMLILLLSVFIVTLNACVAATSIQETLSDEMLQTNQQRNFLRSRNSSDDGVNLQQQPQPLPQQQRVATGEFYRTNSSSILGAPNYMAAIGNPLKGLVGFGPREYLQQSLPDNVPSAIEKSPRSME